MTCWGQMKRPLDATVFQAMVSVSFASKYRADCIGLHLMISDWIPHQVSSRLAQAGVLLDSGEGEAGREAVTLHFPEGIPRRRDLPLSAPQLVLGMTVRLIALESILSQDDGA